MSFSEEIFILSLMQRPEDCKIYSTLFSPAWLQTVEYRPVLEEVYEFNKKYGLPPSVSALRKSIENKDPGMYQSRYKQAIDKIENIAPKPEVSDQVLALETAKEVAIVRSLRDLVSNPVFQALGDKNRGHDQMQQIVSWMRNFQVAGQEIEMNLQEAIKYMQTQKGWNNKDAMIGTGIDVFDRMLGGGLRPKNLGIILAPTGGGKSLSLTIMAKKIASVEEKNVMFITNELSMEETTERLIASLTSSRIEDFSSLREQAEEEPIFSTDFQSTQLSKHWQYNLHERIRLWEVQREISTDEIEAMIARNRSLYGWKPDVIIVDYMERMKPTASGLRRADTWSWYGNIAKDLCRVSKKHNAVVWTAAQLNRSGQKSADVIDLTTAQGSIQHAQEAAAVISVRIMDRQDGKGQMMGVQCQKARFAKKFQKEIFFEVDVGKMIITNNECKRVTHSTDKKKTIKQNPVSEDYTE